MINLKIFSVTEYVAHLNKALYEHDAEVGERSEYRVNQQKWIFLRSKTKMRCLNGLGRCRIRAPLEDGCCARVMEGRAFTQSGKEYECRVGRVCDGTRLLL